MFHQSTCGSAIESIRSPFEPIISGIRRPGGGSSTRSSADQNRPASVTRSPASIRRTISNDSSKRDTRWSYGSPKARYSVSFQPAPRPSTNLPPLTSSTVAAIFAISPGGWNDGAGDERADRARAP